MPPVRSNTKRNRLLRDQILNAALRLFSGKGYFNTSIQDIQREADVSMGSIYNYFSGKESIARALYDNLLAQMDELVDEVKANNASAHDQGKGIVAAMFELTESQPEVVAYILNARHREFLVDEPGICSSSPFEKMRDIVLQGMQRGEVRQMDPWLAASLAFGPALRMISLRLDGMVPTALPEHTEDVWAQTWICLKLD